MKKIKFLAAILAVSILVGCFSLPVGASDGIESYTSSASINTEGALAKIETMESVFKNDKYELFFDANSGEIAIKTLATGEYTFSNPYDAEVPKTNVESGFARKAALLSQIMIKYSDAAGTAKHLSSYGDAAMLEGQIQMKRIDGGIRVEYAIGSVESKRLVPFRIEEKRFEEKIVTILEAVAAQDNKLTDLEKQIVSQLKTVYYDKIDYMNANDTEKQTLLKRYPILADEPNLVFYVLKDESGLTLKKIENLIRSYCPEYTFDELESDHELTGYEGNQIEPPLFRLAIEYTFNDDGFCATVPAKSIRYNETTYSLDEISVLPYFGCSTVREVSNSDATEIKQTTDGYLFLPDGSGTLLEYYNRDGSVKTGTQAISVYGIDYAYEDLTAAETTVNAKVCRIPVFGLTEEYTITTEAARSGRANYVYSKDYKRGFVAVITEGESLAKITATLDAMQWTGYFSASSGAGYNTVYAGFSMQQTDKVSLGSALGGGSSMSQSVDTRYIGNYSIQYMLLAEDTEGFYAPSYSGMAEAYRQFLINDGAISKFTADEVKDQLPLYIQTLGSLKADSTFLTFPVRVTKALASFDDIETMTDVLEGANITNIKYILTGYANGTATSSKYPSYVKFNSTVGGNKGFKELVDFALEKDIEVMPNFDFANITNTAFGFSFKKHAALMMSGRYATKRDYDAVYQTISRRGHSNLLSTLAYDTVFEKFSKAFDKFFTEFDGYNGSLAALTLGTDLNSDFNTDNPITREDSKNNTVEFISKLYNKYDSLIVEGGNSYTIPYVTDIISIPLDNSNYAISSASIPFMGMVLHGCMSYTGDPMNMSGDIKYTVLKSIENGASPYFFLVYQNAAELKASKILSSYYSVNFETWFNTDDGTSIPDTYNKINNAIGALQDATITNHEFHLALALDTDEAAMLFAEYNAAVKALEDAKKAYDAAVIATDEAAKASKNLATLLVAERTAKNAYVAAVEKLERVESMLNRNNVGGVVSVTYTSATTTKTFYINYNNYEVVFETEDGGTYAIGAMDFIEKDDIVSDTTKVAESTSVEAYVATGSVLVANFASANEKLESALESGDDYLINRALGTMNALLAEVAKTKDGDVAKIKNTDGSYVYINYTSGGVIVKIDETRYELISAQSYLVVEPTTK